MLSSITPLGQRGRGGSWLRTVIAFWAGAVAAGALVFGTLGFVGALLGVPQLNPWYSLIVLALVGVIDLIGGTPPGLHRQVDEDWLGKYRDWVTGLGFGVQLGSGFATIIPSFGTWALFLLAMGAENPLALGIGIAFGVGRSLLLVSTRTIGSPSALAENMRRFAGRESTARWLSLAAYAVVFVMVGINVV